MPVPDAHDAKDSVSVPLNWVLLGGIARESARWGDAPMHLLQQLRRVEGGAQLHLLDLPGTGKLWQERSPSRVAELVEQMRQRARHLPKPLGLVAGSGSAALATEWATRYPEEVAAMVLMNPALRPFTHLLRSVRLRLWPTLLALMLGRRSPLALDERLFASTTSRRADVETLDSQWQRLSHEHPVKLRNALRQGLAVWRYRASRRRPLGAQGRVLLLAGRKDEWFDWRVSQAISRAWGAALRMHPEGGHDLLLDDPDWVARAMSEWLVALRHGGSTPL